MSFVTFIDVLHELLRWPWLTQLPPTFQKPLEPVYSYLAEQGDTNYVGKDRENQLPLFNFSSISWNK